MPYSSEEGKKWVRSVLQQLRVGSVVDVGVGAGTYVKRFKQREQRWTGIEIHEPYIDEYFLRLYYDQIILGDVRNITLPIADLYIFGDVIEHLERNEAIQVLNNTKKVTSHILVSLPIVPWVQEAMHGNQHEAHLYHWSATEIINVLEPVDSFVGDEIGVFLWSAS